MKKTLIKNQQLSNKCAFLIVTYNSREDIRDCISSIKKFHSESGIFVVDNNSLDGTKEILREIEGINLTILPVNSGYPGGNNLAIKKAKECGYSFFFLFNPDARLTHKILNSLIKLSIEKKALVGPIIKDFNSGKIQSIGGKFNPIFSLFFISNKITKRDLIQKRNFVKVDWILGAALFISNEIVEKCGYFDENFFPASLEDSCYCIEARKLGIPSLIDLNTNILHKGGTSSGGDKKYLLRIIRNRFYYALIYQKNLFFITTIIESSLRYLYHKFFGILRK